MCGQYAVHGRVQNAFLFLIMCRQQVPQNLLLVVALGILRLHLAVDRFECLPDLPVLCAHDGGWASLHSRARFPHWKQNVLFPHDMPLQPQLEFHKTCFRVRMITLFELMELLQ